MGKKGLKWKTKIGYGLCTGAETIPYNLIAIYFVFFLTDVVGLRAYMAGVIAFVVILWDAVICPVVGGLSDRYVTEKGRRLPWLKFSLLPLAVSICLMFFPFVIDNTLLQSLYYILVTMLVCLCYTAFIVPYFALGAEITSDYSQRNVLRFYSMFLYYPIFLFTASGPMVIWDLAADAGYTDRQAWGFIGLVFGLLLVMICGIGVFLIRNCEKDTLKNAIEANKTRVKHNMFKIWGHCLRIKSFKKIVIWIFLFMFGFSTIETVIVYFMTHNVNMTETQQATFWVVYVLFIVCLLPVVTPLCNKFGKKPILLAAMLPGIVLGFVLFFTGINSIVVVYLYASTVALSSSVFFTYYIGCAYDCVEIDEFLSGERKGGSIISLATFAQQMGSAIAMPFTGILLEFAGYNGMAETQTEGALRGILSLSTLIPAVLLLAAFLFLLTYPVTRNKYELLCRELENKRNGKAYSTVGFENIL